MSGALKCEVHQNSSVGLLKHRLLGHLQSVWVCRSNIGPKPAFLARSQVVLLLALEHSLKITALFPSTETGHLPLFRGFPGGSDTKESTCNVGDPDSIPGSGKSPGGGNGNPLQRSLAGYSPGGHKRVGYDQACTHTHTHTGVQSGQSSQTQHTTGVLTWSSWCSLCSAPTLNQVPPLLWDFSHPPSSKKH